MLIDTRFPEYLFPAPEQYSEQYEKYVLQGKELCEESSVIFCGICRNIEPVARLNLERIYKTAEFFKEHRIVIYENDSTDNTVAEQSVDDDNLHLISNSRESSNYREKDDPDQLIRATELAECRNVYMDYISSMEDVDKFDYVVVIDLDLKGGWSYEGFLNSFAYLEVADCVTSYGILTEYTNTKSLEEVEQQYYMMFDSWAMRPLEVFDLRINEVSGFNHLKTVRGEPPLLVNSNFNGLAIYKREPFLKFRYSANSPGAGYTVNCDHPCLHKQMVENGYSILLNPSMITSYSTHRYCK